MSLIVDASVGIKWYVDEPGTAQAVDVLARDDLVAPDLIFAEVGNAFWKRIHRGVSNLDQARRNVGGSGRTRLANHLHDHPDPFRQCRQPLIGDDKRRAAWLRSGSSPSKSSYYTISS